MKKTLFMCVLSILFFSCEKNPCKEVDCGEHGICNGANGECACLDGYTKDATGKCTVAPIVNTEKPRDKFLGTYIVTEQGQNASPNPFTVQINPGFYDSDVILVGHGNILCGNPQEPISMPGVVGGAGLLFNDYHRYCDNTNYIFYQFSVSTILNNSFTVNYSISGGLGKSVTATFVKQ